MHGINYRVKRIGRFKTTPDDSSKTARNEKGPQTFQNPIYDDSEVLKHELPDSHYNSSYKLTENSDAMEGDKQEPAVYNHDNPGYEMTSDHDREA